MKIIYFTKKKKYILTLWETTGVAGETAGWIVWITGPTEFKGTEIFDGIWHITGAFDAIPGGFKTTELGTDGGSAELGTNAGVGRGGTTDCDCWGTFVYTKTGSSWEDTLSTTFSPTSDPLTADTYGKLWIFAVNFTKLSHSSRWNISCSGVKFSSLQKSSQDSIVESNSGQPFLLLAGSEEMLSDCTVSLGIVDIFWEELLQAMFGWNVDTFWELLHTTVGWNVATFWEELLEATLGWNVNTFWEELL